MFQNMTPLTVSPPEYDSSNRFSAGDNDVLGTLSADFRYANLRDLWRERGWRFYWVGFERFIRPLEIFIKRFSDWFLLVLVLFPLTQGWWTGYLGLSEYLDGRVEMMLTDGRSILGLNSGSGRVVRYQVLCVEGEATTGRTRILQSNLYDALCSSLSSSFLLLSVVSSFLMIFTCVSICWIGLVG